jgi:MFS transporter, DHA3 family, tetracycline resistance protein
MLGVLRGPFGLLWAGQSVSLVGDSVFLVAFTWQIAVEWQRPALLGVLLSARILVELVVLGGGGWIIDRVPRRTTVLVADGVRGVILLALASALHQPISTPTLALLVAAFGLLTGLFRPALLAFVPEVVQRERLPAANSLLGLSQQSSVVLGPAIGAGLVGLGSAPTALRLDGLSFMVAALTTLPLPRRPPASPSGSPLAQVAEGFRTARRVGWIGGSILLFSMVNIATISAERLALPRAAEERFGALGGYGAVLVAIGVGAALAALAVGRLPAPRRPGRTAYSGLVLFGGATAGFGVARGLVAAVVIGLAFGFGQQLFELLWTIGLQQNVPNRLLGRISAVDQFGSFLFLPLSFAFGGLLVQSVNPELVMIAAGLAGLAAATIGLSVPTLHQWRPFPAGIADAPASPTTNGAAPPTGNGAAPPHAAHVETSRSFTRP